MARVNQGPTLLGDSARDPAVCRLIGRGLVVRRFLSAKEGVAPGIVRA